MLKKIYGFLLVEILHLLAIWWACIIFSSTASVIHSWVFQNLTSLKYTTACRPVLSLVDMKYMLHANQITDPATAEWTDRNLTLESDSSLLETKHAGQLERQCFKLLRNCTCLFASLESLACVSPCYNKVIMEDIFNAEATATTRIIIFIKHTLRTDNTLFNYKETVGNHDWKYYCRMDSSS